MLANEFVKTAIGFISLFCIVERGSLHPLTLKDDKIEELTIPKIKLSDRISLYGDCAAKGQLLHAEDIQIENQGPSTISGSFEFQIDLPATITCVEIADRGDIDSLSNPTLSAGGPGHKWLAVKVNGNYGKGIFVFVRVVGVPETINPVKKTI